MSDGAAQSGGIQAAAAGEAAAVVPAAVTASAAAAAAPAASGAVAAAPAPAAPFVAAPVPQAALVANPVHVVVAAPAAVAPASAPHKDDADCKPKKVAAKDGDKALPDDADQNLAQPADGCVLPADGQAAAPAPVQESAPVIVDDGEGGGISSGLLIGAGVLAAVGVGVLALSGDKNKNGAPVANPDTGAVNEGASLTGSVATNDSDPNNDALTYTLTGTTPGLTLSSNGSYTFDANNAAYNDLAAGQTRVVTANYSVADPSGATATSTLTITVTGTNDVPVAVADTAAVNEDATVTGNLRTNDTDPDAGANLVYSVVGTAPAGLTLNADGTYSFNAGNAAYQGLAAGQTQQVVVNYQVTDGTATATSTLTITVTGVAEAPVAVADTNAGLEDTQITGSVATNDTDADTPAADLTYTVVGTAPAGFTLNSNGTYTLDATNAAYQGLAAGEVQNVVVNYQVSDGARTSASTLTIAVTGVAEGPAVIAASLDVDDATNNPATLYVLPVSADTGSFAYTDLSGTANTVQVNGFGADDYITFDLPFTGANKVSFTSGDFDNDGASDDLSITTNVNGVVSDIVLTNVVAPGALVFDEASADAAVAGADNFRTTASAPPPPVVVDPVGTTAQSLDADDNSNPNDSRIFDAGTGSFRFTDDADVANNAVIINLSTNDQIVLEAGNQYSFTSSASDIIVTINKGGIVSELVIKDAIVNPGLVFDEASAEKALGNINYFSFA